MKRLCFFLLLNFIFFSISAQTWEWSNPKPCGNVMLGIYFTDPSTGYIVGTGGIIMKSTDGGDTWNILNSGTLYDLYDVHFPDANTGYVVGAGGTILKTTDAGSTWIIKQEPYDYLFAVNFPSVDIGYTCFWTTVWPGWVRENILKTTDGGETWNELSATVSPQKLYFMTSDTGICTGQSESASGIIKRTTDGGMTWDTCWSSSTILYTQGISFIDHFTGFVVGGNGTILKTTNGGATWQSLTSGITNDLYSVFFINALTGFVVGDNGMILKTTNGGITWTIRTVISDGIFYSTWGGDVDNFFFIGQKKSSDYESRMYKTSDGGNNFSNMLNGTLHDLNGICFPLSNTGFAVGDSGVIVRTVDGGNSWSILNTGDTVSLNAVDFPSAGIGYAVGMTGRILKTTNGGVSWVVQTTGTIQPLRSVDFYDENTGFAVGDSGTILKTTNGGISWTSQVSGTLQNLHGVSIADASTIYIAAWGAIIKTTDGGSTWVTIKTCSTYDFYYSIDFLDQNIGYVAGSEILKTIDGGATWDEFSFNWNYDFYTVCFSDALTGYAVGMLNDQMYYPASGIIKLTTDGGETWIDQSICNNRALHAVCITPENAGVACGEFGTILKTTNGGVGISSKPINTSIKVFPNPASDMVTIDSQRAMNGEIAIFNTDGRNIFTSSVTGKKIATIDISNLVPGVYCVSITDDQKIRVVEKFIKK